MTDEIIFTDRYGGNLPSALTVCRGQCEGLGVHPTQINESNDISAFHEDNWQFITCETCGGSGKASRWETVTRIPGWIYRGLRFMFTAPRQFDPAMSRRKAWTLGFKIAFLADLGLWQPMTRNDVEAL